ncbi:hypothetical protein AB0N21_39405 [Streptomyces sp. NPDC051080]|uniref:hypothetical protein n=1 Tax=Streptomyces sp. NPDC051080 TaxID=3157222 RepID=UPI00341F6D4D
MIAAQNEKTVTHSRATRARPPIAAMQVIRDGTRTRTEKREPMNLKARTIAAAIGTTLITWGIAAPAQASSPPKDGQIHIQGTIKCAPESKTYTVKKKPGTAIRTKPAKDAPQVDTVYFGNKVSSKFSCVNNGWIFVCISLCKVDENGIAGRWVFRGDIA